MRAIDSKHHFDCPIPGCDYTNESVQGIAAHVGHHDDGWQSAEKEAWELHIEATDRSESDCRRVNCVKEWLASEFPETDKLAVYVHQSYDSVQIRPVGYIEKWTAFIALVGETEGLQWNRDVAYCTDEFESRLRDECGSETSKQVH